MSKIAVVYWSGTGNTEAMANEVAEGAKAAGAEVDYTWQDEVLQLPLAFCNGPLFGSSVPVAFGHDR